jgi:MFS family permease
MLAIPNGVSFWPVSCFAVIQSSVAAELGDATQGVWFTAVYPLAATVAFMVCGVNSDLFGRRYFIVFGNLLLTIGSIVAGSAKSTSAVIVGMALTGFGGGNCQLAAFALPELLPNKYRPAAIVLAETTNYINIIVGPAASRYALEHGAWRWLLYSMSIVVGCTGVGTVLLYFPPKHPRGIPWWRAFRELDYIGAITFTAATVLILGGINYASYLPSSDPKVIAMLVVGFAMLVIFACWETFMPLKQPLTPTRIFTRNYGRTFTAPFIAGLMVSMFYLGILVVWNTMIAVFFTTSTSSTNKAIELSLAQGFGILTGAILMGTLGQRVGHWKWQMFGALTGTTLFGGLLALGEPSRQGMSIAFVFLASIGYGWGQYLSIAYIQFGADQIELGIAGGLA